MGIKSHPLFATWRRMRERCESPKRPDYPRYGGRGITVCERWRSFSTFVADMGPKPTPAHTLDRIDNARGYEPGNCRWATQTEQQRNRTNNRLHELDGERLTAAEWADRRGLPRKIVQDRTRRGWSIVDALAPYEPGRRKRLSGSRAREAAARAKKRADDARSKYAEQKIANGGRNPRSRDDAPQ